MKFNISEKTRRFLPTLLLLTSAIACLGVNLVGKSYSIPSIEVQTRIQANGDLVVSEHISYRFKDRYSYAFRTIPLRPGEEITALSVGESGVDYSADQSEEPATFLTRGEDSGLEVRWFFKARNETRTFVMTYTIRGAVHRYPDVAELHYEFLGSGWSKPIGSLTARVDLPAGVDSGSVRAWVRDPVRGTVLVTGEGIHFSARDWPRGRAFAGRVLFPASGLSGLQVEGSRAMKEAITQAEEQDLQRLLVEESERRELGSTLFPWMFILPALTWLVWYMLFLQHGRRHSVRTSIPPGQLPDHDPLFANWVRSRSVGAQTLVATLFDLARRGHLTIREEEPASEKARKKKQNDYFFEIKKGRSSDLRPFELDLIEFVTTQAGDRMGFRISDLKRVAKKKQSLFRKWFRKWVKLFRVEAEAQDIYEPYPTGAMVLNALLGLSMLITGAIVCAITASPTGLPAIILGALQTGFTGFLKRRTREGQRLFQEWSEFRNHVRRGEAAHLQLQQGWDKPLIAAVSLGHEKQFNRLLDQAHQNPVTVPWLEMLDGGTSGVNSLSSSLQSMVTTVSSSATSVSAGASGAGAGASGGGGGGAG